MQVQCNDLEVSRVKLLGGIISAKDLENKVTLDEISESDENGNGLEQGYKLLRYRLAFTDKEFQQAVTKTGLSLLGAYDLMIVAIAYGDKIRQRERGENE